MKISFTVAAISSICLSVVSCSQGEARKHKYLASADRLFAAHRYQEAILEYRNALQYDAKFGQARYQLGRAYLAVNDGLNAYKELVRAADLMPDDSAVQLQAGSVLLVAKKFEDAKARANRVLQKEPRNVDAQILLGNALVGLNDLDGAITQMEQAIEGDPQRTLTYDNLGVIKFAKGDRRAAEQAFKRAISLSPNSSKPHLSLANFYWASGDLPAAETELKTAVELDPQSADANRSLAAFYLTSKRRAEAEKYLKTYADVSSDQGAKFVLADFYAVANRSSEALSILESLAKSKEGFVSASLRIAALEYESGKHDAAYKVVDAVLQREPRNIASRRLKSRFLLNDGKPQEALMLAKAVVADESESVANQYALGLALHATGEVDEAIKAFQHVLQLRPDAVAAQLVLAKTFLARGDAVAAGHFAEQAINNQPNNGAAHLILAQALIARNDLANAESELARLTKSGGWAEVYTTLAALQLKKGEPAAARKAYARALELDPKSLDGLTGLIRLDVSEKKAAAARERIEARLNASPNDAAVLIIAGQTYSSLGDYKAAEMLFRRALRANPSNLDAYGFLARLFVAQHRLDEAKSEFEEVARRNARSIEAPTMVGFILYIQGRRDEARARYEQVLALNPRATVAANNLAWMYAERGENLDIALQLAQTAKAQLPNQPDVNDTLGWIYAQKGLPQLAIPPLLSSVQKDPDNATYAYHLGFAYSKAGDHSKAKAALQKAVSLGGSSTDAREAKKLLASIG